MPGKDDIENGISLIHNSVNDDRRTYAVTPEVHLEGRLALEKHLVHNTDGIVLATLGARGIWNAVFEGPDSLDGEQRQACIQVVMDILNAEEAAAAVPAAARVRPSRSAAAIAEQARVAAEEAGD